MICCTSYLRRSWLLDLRPPKSEAKGEACTWIHYSAAPRCICLLMIHFVLVPE